MENLFNSLLKATGDSNLEEINLLLDRGADINEKNGIILILYCTMPYTTNVNVVQLLLDRGADVHAQNDEALIRACQSHRHFEIVKLLLDRGADINAQNGKALFNAGYSLELTQILIDKKVYISLTLDYYGLSFTSKESKKVFKLLLKIADDIHDVDKLFSLACYFKDIETITELAKRDINIYIRNNKVLENKYL